MRSESSERIRTLARLVSYELCGDGRNQSPPPYGGLVPLAELVIVWLKWGLGGLWGSSAPVYTTRFALLEAAAKEAPPEGLWLEFGVFEGKSINHIARQTSHQVVGFDSFEGLPTGWTPRHPKGRFTTHGTLPQVENNVRLVRGWFSETLRQFLSTQGVVKVSFLHIDCDLYQSTKLVLSELGERIGSRTVIVFDEYATVFPDDEFRAFREFLRSTGRRFHYVGCSAAGSVAVQVIS
jgi:Macrocin-O-methyltransferase (TylF)